MAKTHTEKNKNQSEQSQGQNTDFSKLYTQDIVKAFVDKMDQRNDSFIGVSSKEKTIQAFEEFVKEEYDDNILLALKEGKVSGQSVDIELNKIVDKGFTIDDLLSPTKSSVIKNAFGSMTSESQAIQHALLQCHHKRSQSTQQTKNNFKFDDFLRQIGYSGTTDPQGKLISLHPLPKGKKQSLSGIKFLWKDFVANSFSNSNHISDFADMLDTNHFDPTEKIACISAVRGLHHKIGQISKGDAKKFKKIETLWMNTFGSDALYDPVGVNRTWTELSGLEKDMEDFFGQLALSGVATKKDMNQFKSIAITTKSCAMIGEKSGDLPAGVYDEKIKNQKFSQLSGKLQHMVNAFVQVDLINNVADTLENIDVSLDNYAQVFDMPGNMGKFFEKFGLPSELSLDKNSYEYKLHTAEYQRKHKEYQDFLQLHKGKIDTDPVLQAQRQNLDSELQELLSIINPNQAYTSLKLQARRLQDKLSQTTDPVEKEKLIKQLSTIDTQITQHKVKKQPSTRDAYFDHIAQEVDHATTVIGVSHITGHDLITVLKKLQSSHRNVAEFSLDEQNILMQGSLAIQLKNVKESDIHSSLGYRFQEYAAFVSGLYDLRTPSQSIIMSKDQQPITLDFTSKKIIGKPLERHNIDVSDVSKLENIRVEFELDLNGNKKAEEFVRIMTGGDDSHLIQDFLPGDYPNFPKTITDSSKVKMIDKDGNAFTGYLSRYENPDDELLYDRQDGSTPQAESSTYILYSEPADTLSTTRQVKTWKNSTSPDGKNTSVFVNMDNVADWQSIEITDKKVRLSDQHLNALTLGHAAMSQMTQDEFFDPQNKPKIQEIIKAADENYASSLQKNNRDINTDSNISSTTETNTEASESETFQHHREELVGSADKSIVCEPGRRFVLDIKDKAVKSIPDSPQSLSAIVKEVKKDSAGKVIGCTFGFETLSRSGKCYIKDVMLTGDQLPKLKEVFGSVKYLDHTSKDPQDYTSTLQRLQKLYPTTDKSYNFALFSDLDFKGNTFKKDKEEVIKFVAPKATGDANGSGKEKYDVEYTIKKLGNNYHITSSPYEANITTSKGDKKTTKKENITFDTVTDMAGMLMILAGKKLIPYTSLDEKNLEYADIKDGTIPTRGSRSRTISTIRSVLKGGGKSIMEGLKKKIGGDEEDELKQVLFSEMNLYRKLSDGPVGKLLGVFNLDVFDDMADEAEKSGMDYGWKKIEGYYNYLSSFHPAWNTGIRKGGLQIAKEMMSSAVSSYRKNGNPSYKDRLKTGGTLLYMLEKMKSGYSKDFAEFERGIFVKIMLGPQAHAIYERNYKKLEIESRENTAIGYKKREQLLLLEYNFITDSIRGGPNTDPNDVRSQSGIDPFKKDNNPFYFQHLYSREFANKLSEKVGEVKSIPTDKSDKGIETLINSNNFTHVYNECRDHIGQLRVADAVKELIALQSLAGTKEEGDKVSMLFMAGILNGAFIYNLGAKTKENLKIAMRNSSFPYPQVIEHFDAPEKVQALLSLATGDLGDEAFDKFKYGKKDKQKERVYMPNDFKSTDGNNKEKIDGFVQHFELRRKDHESRVVPFLHMDPESLKTNDNLIRVWKSQDPNLKIYGQPVDTLARQAVNEIMSELYTNRSRGANLDNYNFVSGLSHTATTIENFYRDSVNKYKGQDRDPSVGDHAGIVRDSIEKSIPDREEGSQRKDMLAHQVDEFFRVFQGMGSFDYEESQIATFYKHLRLARGRTEPDRSRLIWFFMTKSLFTKGPVPAVVERSFAKYMKYFEKNLQSFDEELGANHNTPGNPSKTFRDAFNDGLEDVAYVNKDERDAMRPEKQRELTSKINYSGEQDLLNADQQDANKRARGNGRYNNSNQSIQMSIDDKITKLRGGMLGKVVSTTSTLLKPQIDSTNYTDIDYSALQTSKKKESSDQGFDYTPMLSQMNPKNMTPEQLEEYKRVEEFRKNQFILGNNDF